MYNAEFPQSHVYYVLYNYIADAPLNINNLQNALKKVTNWKVFSQYLKLPMKDTWRESLQLFAAHSGSTWKQLSVALYHTNENEAIDDLFYYMKSPNGVPYNYSCIIVCLSCDE